MQILHFYWLSRATGQLPIQIFLGSNCWLTNTKNLWTNHTPSVLLKLLKSKFYFTKSFQWGGKETLVALINIFFNAAWWLTKGCDKHLTYINTNILIASLLVSILSNAVSHLYKELLTNNNHKKISCSAWLIYI